MLPRMFIASSVERLSLARAAQEELERDIECTVWSQGVFSPSLTSPASLLRELEDSDFGLFIFAPDDIVVIRDEKHSTVRDNVVFELGLFVGRLGVERCFVLTPQSLKDGLHLPTDLLGLAQVTFDANRQDGNEVASLGPACNRIRRTVLTMGRIVRRSKLDANSLGVSDEHLFTDSLDCLALIKSWMGSRPANLNSEAIIYSDVDRELKLAPGSAAKYIESAAYHWGYIAVTKGEAVILFEHRLHSG